MLWCLKVIDWFECDGGCGVDLWVLFFFFLIGILMKLFIEVLFCVQFFVCGFQNWRDVVYIVDFYLN